MYRVFQIKCSFTIYILHTLVAHCDRLQEIYCRKIPSKGSVDLCQKCEINENSEKKSGLVLETLLVPKQPFLGLLKILEALKKSQNSHIFDT